MVDEKYIPFLSNKWGRNERKNDHDWKNANKTTKSTWWNLDEFGYSVWEVRANSDKSKVNSEKIKVNSGKLIVVDAWIALTLLTHSQLT